MVTHLEFAVVILLQKTRLMRRHSCQHDTIQEGSSDQRSTVWSVTCEVIYWTKGTNRCIFCLAVRLTETFGALLQIFCQFWQIRRTRGVRIGYKLLSLALAQNYLWIWPQNRKLKTESCREVKIVTIPSLHLRVAICFTVSFVEHTKDMAR